MFILPVGPDWADGKTLLPAQPLGATGSGTVGTPHNADQRQVEAANGGHEVTVEQLPDSPEIERAEQGTFQHRLRMSYEEAISYLNGLGRGTFVRDSGRLFGVQTTWRILSSKVKREKGNTAELSYTAESISFDSPPDEFSISTSDLGLDILKHPRYAWALNPIVGDNTSHLTVGDTPIFFTDLKTSIIRIIQAYRDAPFFPSANQVNGLIQTNIMSQLKSGKMDIHINNTAYDGTQPTVDPPRWDGTNANKPPGNYQYAIVGVPVDLTDNAHPVTIALAAGKEVISKLWRQEDTPYIPIIQISWAQYFFAPIHLDLGAYIQDPFGVVPDYFMDPNQDGSDNIFSQLSAINPQCFSATGLTGGPVNVSWLRKADSVEYERTWFKVTRTWVGSPIGTWDLDLYTTNSRPQLATDYTQLV